MLDAGRDLKIFGEKIAPKLGITVRFVVEEPNDKITYQYNESMKVLLPAYGIKLVEIPRMMIGGTVFGACVCMHAQISLSVFLSVKLLILYLPLLFSSCCKFFGIYILCFSCMKVLEGLPGGSSFWFRVSPFFSDRWSDPQIKNAKTPYKCYN